VEDETGSSPDLYSSIGEKTKPRYFYNSAASAFLLLGPSRFELATNRLEILSTEIDKKKTHSQSSTPLVFSKSCLFHPISAYFGQVSVMAQILSDSSDIRFR